MRTIQKDASVILDTLTRIRHTAYTQVCEEIKLALPRLMAGVVSKTIPSDIPEWFSIGVLAAIAPDGSLCWETLKGVLAGRTLIQMERAWAETGRTLSFSALDSGLDLLAFAREAWDGLEQCGLYPSPKEDA